MPFLSLLVPFAVVISFIGLSLSVSSHNPPVSSYNQSVPSNNTAGFFHVLECSKPPFQGDPVPQGVTLVRSDQYDCQHMMANVDTTISPASIDTFSPAFANFFHHVGGICGKPGLDFWRRDTNPPTFGTFNRPRDPKTSLRLLQEICI